MPAIGVALSELIKVKVDAYMKSAYPYGGPLAGQITQYYIQFCDAIANGIVNKSLGKIKFITQDVGLMGAPPVPGTGVGKGIKVDAEWFNENLYKKIGSIYPNLPAYPPATKTVRWLDPFGIEHVDVSEVHPPYPDKSDYSNGMFMECVTKGIAESVKEHYEKAWNLKSDHPLIYIGGGTIKEKKFNGLIAAEIGSEIVKLGSSLSGPYWIQLANAIAEIYVEAIHEHSTAKVKIGGVCIPSATPLQVCGLPSGGTGIGDAL